MDYLFDTNIIIGFLKNDPSIVEKFSKIDRINISAITIGEMIYGAHNSEKVNKNIENYNNFFIYCEIYNITDSTARYYGEIKYKLKKIGKPIPENDIWIAAVAKENNFKIITKDKHLKNIDFISTEEW